MISKHVESITTEEGIGGNIGAKIKTLYWSNYSTYTMLD